MFNDISTVGRQYMVFTMPSLTAHLI